MSAKLLFLALSSLPVFSLAANITCPPTPSPFPKAASFPKITTLPDPFVYLDGSTRVQTREEWYACRQPEIMKLLQEYQYGYYPDHSLEIITATRSGKTLTVTIAVGSAKASIAATVNLPSSATKTAPVGVVIAIGGIDNNAFLNKGIAVVTFDYSSVAADSNSKTGSFWTLYKGKDAGTLLAWAWGFHRVLDGLILQVPEIDSKKVGVTGCSRLGKAALAAGLFDTRITVTIPESAGIQGIGPYRYHALSGQDETLENSKSGAPWWSNAALGTFVNQMERLPFDAHTIAAAIAPRALVIDQGRSDPYVNSKGTAVVVYPATKLVYDWLAAGPDVPAGEKTSKIAIALRDGGHCDMSGYANVAPYVQYIFSGTATTKNYADVSPWKVMPETYPWSSLIPK
ncbi:hypothetical protein ONS95_005468 [Cadophora gregata]|uniref:uncharacterized protein n=1 Tax=Cadophora gregata TaxID=51156 RepID=UPI0026DCE12B|nr:uncharacterized protein ONS95_005468 [Cadophora gregata]KAK0103445.1 hypothetical protein ONS95_005468 [Cadophora gregata]KAK0107635.1 hypothetical protein ONS96_003439 [Cadophora gregata f. sp. sojae]